MTVTEPGIYDGMAELEYHGDPCVIPSLSRSMAVTIITASPAHAYAEHPRLGGSPPTKLAAGDEDMDVGSAVHAAFLQGVDRLAHCPVDSWRSNAAKAMRDQALAELRIPLKTKQYDAARRVIEALEAWRKRTGMFTAGKPEQSVFWHEGDDVWCRARIDWLPDDPEAALLDLKTTGGLATPATWGRACFEHGADLQASMYPRGIEYVRGEPPGGILFVVVETSPPFAIRVFALDPIAVDVGHAKAAAARAVWQQCMAETWKRVAAGRPAAEAWPGYPQEVELILPPPWVVSQWETARFSGIGRAVDDPKLIERMVNAGNIIN
jgi:hypothetical protein